MNNNNNLAIHIPPYSDIRNAIPDCEMGDFRGTDQPTAEAADTEW